MTRPRILSVRKIWARAEHNAFTDLTRFRGAWYCAFREGAGHAGSSGKVRVITSKDGELWRSAALLSEKGADLRDPKLSVAPGSRLMLIMGGTEAAGRQTRVRFSRDGSRWTGPVPILEDGDWLWRATWLGPRAYGISYSVESKNRWTIALCQSRDGLAWEKLQTLAVGGLPNEATLRFLPDRTAVCLLRREGGDRHAWIGHGRPPYTRWKWRSTRHRVGGPNFIVLPSGAMWGGGRSSTPEGPRAVIARMGLASWEPVLELPSSGDCSYPGLALHRGILWVSYYSSHEGRTSIYLARIGLAGAR